MNRAFAPSGCANKKAYLTWQHAARDARNLHRTRGALVAPYHCRCGYVHVGTQQRARRRAA